MKEEKAELAKERTTLATKRTMLANMRTLLSFVRTALIFISVAIAFYKAEKKTDWIVITFVVMSAIFLIWGLIQYAIVRKFVVDENAEE